jgi:protein SCO1/2
MRQGPPATLPRRTAPDSRPSRRRLDRAAGDRARASAARTILAAGGGLLLILVLAAGLFLGFRGASHRDSQAGVIGGPFALTDMNGRAVTDASFLGRFMLLYFGYTRCPDVCPTALATVTAALTQLGPAADRIQPLFVTVDPAHDTPEVLRRYLAAFSPRLLGLTGSPAALAGIEKRYHVEALAGPDGIAHSATLYVMGPDSTFRAALSSDTSASVLASTLRQVMR